MTDEKLKNEIIQADQRLQMLLAMTAFDLGFDAAARGVPKEDARREMRQLLQESDAEARSAGSPPDGEEGLRAVLDLANDLLDREEEEEPAWAKGESPRNETRSDYGRTD